MTTDVDVDHSRSEGDLIDDHRRGIDRIDRTIVALLAERIRLGRAIGEIRRSLRQPARSPEREAEVLDRVRDAARGGLPARSAERIFSVIIEETRAAQRERSGRG